MLEPTSKQFNDYFTPPNMDYSQYYSIQTKAIISHFPLNTE